MVDSIWVNTNIFPNSFPEGNVCKKEKEKGQRARSPVWDKVTHQTVWQEVLEQKKNTQKEKEKQEC